MNIGHMFWTYYVLIFLYFQILLLLCFKKQLSWLDSSFKVLSTCVCQQPWPLRFGFFTLWWLWSSYAVSLKDNQFPSAVLGPLVHKHNCDCLCAKPPSPSGLPCQYHSPRCVCSVQSICFVRVSQTWSIFLIFLCCISCTLNLLSECINISECIITRVQELVLLYS